MASAKLRDELNCSICLSLYTDPVSLRCGHNFCRSCIVTVLDKQGWSGGYSCPYCRADYPNRPFLEKNMKLGNIMEYFSSTQPHIEENRIFCTYCTQFPVPAVKSCLQCEISLCDDHLTAHNKTLDHILAEPTSSFGSKKCPIHKKVLEYYCLQDATYLCVSCCLVGEHRGHQVELLDEASEKKKEKLRKYLEEINSQKEGIPVRVQNLYSDMGIIQGKASEKRKNVSKLFKDIKKQLEMEERKVLCEISRQEEKIVSQISDLIEKLKKKEDELSRKMRHLEEMCHDNDKIRLLQDSDITVCGHGDGEDTGGDDEKSEYDLDEVSISLTLRQSMRDIVTNVTSQLGFHVPDILLDEDTAGNYLKLSEDLKTATESKEKQNRTESPGRFLRLPQVLSRRGLSSGRHYWEVEWNQIGDCIIGMSYPSIRKKTLTGIGDNDKSWSLIMYNATYKSLHNSVQINLNVKAISPKLGVFLDYEAGRLSFYELCDPIRHLHTFTASFIEPLHAAFYMNKGASVTIRS